MEYKIKRSFLKDQGIIYTVYFKDGKRYVVASRHENRGEAIKKLSFLMARDNSSFDLTQVSKNFCIGEPIGDIEEVIHAARNGKALFHGYLKQGVLFRNGYGVKPAAFFQNLRALTLSSMIKNERLFKISRIGEPNDIFDTGKWGLETASTEAHDCRVYGYALHGDECPDCGYSLHGGECLRCGLKRSVKNG